MNITTTINTFYSTTIVPPLYNNLFDNFNGHRFPFDYLFLQVILWIFTILSIFMNLIIVGTTIKSTKLKEDCHILIAIESGCNALLQFNRWPPFILSLTCINFISLYKCFWLQILPLFVSLIGTGLILIIGVERLICIAFPLWFRKKSFKIIINLLNILNIGHSFYSCLMVFIVIINPNYGQNQVVCQIEDIFSDQFTSSLIFTRGEIIHLLIIIVYLFIMFLILFKFKNLSETSKGLIKSLMGIVFFEIFCWCPIVFFPMIISSLNLDQFGLLYLSTIYYIILAIVSSINLPILYYMSKLYREEIKKFIKLIIWQHSSINNSVGDIKIVHSNIVKI